MNIFETLTERLEARFVKDSDVRLDIGEPVQKSGLWTLSIICADGFLLELGWQRHRGFALSAGYDLDFGTGFDELCDDEQGAYGRVLELVESREPTDSELILKIAEVRKLLGVLQSDLASQVGMTKGGLAQIEGKQSLSNMQIGTVGKLIEALGGQLVLTANFPDGKSRKLSV